MKEKTYFRLSLMFLAIGVIMSIFLSYHNLTPQENQEITNYNQICASNNLLCNPIQVSFWQWWAGFFEGALFFIVPNLALFYFYKYSDDKKG